MASRAKRAVAPEPEALDAAAVLDTYAGWLKRQSLSDRSRQAYLAQVRTFLSWLGSCEHGAAALAEGHVRDWAVRDYKRHAKTARRWAPTSVNQALAAIDNFYRSLGTGRPEVPREELAQVAPRALDEADQRVFLRIVEACPSARDRAIATAFFYAALRLSELAALDVDDIEMSARRGRVRVRAGKGDAYREVPLNSACRKALDEWLEARADQRTRLAVAGRGVDDGGAMWLSRSGGRMSPRAVDMVVRRLAAEARLELSSHVLRHTCVTNLKVSDVATKASFDMVCDRCPITEKGYWPIAAAG
ncbi:MAG: tyrosine-type recombinase/integrase [Acidimicrobiales bacterium]